MNDEALLSRLEAIEASIRKLKNQSSDWPFDHTEAADYLHISKSHLYQLTSKGLITHHKPAGKKLFFLKKDLDDYLLRNRIASKGDIDEKAETYQVTHPSKARPAAEGTKGPRV